MTRMSWMWTGAALLTVTACGENPLTDRFEKLEAKVDELEANQEEQEEQQQELLARLDRIPVTTENAAELAEVRAKLAQTGISNSEFQALRRRVEALEKLVYNWSQIVSRYQRSVYTVIHYVWHDDEEINSLLNFVGTAFAVGNTALITNGHIVDALHDLDGHFADFSRRWKIGLKTDWLLVRNLTSDLKYKSNYYWAGRWRYHEDWDTDDVFSPDVALLRPYEGTISTYHTMPLVTSSAARRLRIGTPVATLGYPGELQVSNFNDIYPVATFKNGTISAVRMPDDESKYSVGGAYIVQYDLNLTGGTSGSPVFNTEGEVVAINNSGVETLALSLGGALERVPLGALDFGIRADKIHELLQQAGVAAKPAGAESPGARLDGMKLSDLEIGSPDDDLTERLKERLGL